MMEIESPLDSCTILFCGIHFFDREVTGDHNLLRPDMHRASFGLTCERINIRPHFDVLRINHVWSQLLYNNYFLVVISVPPFVCDLLIGCRVRVVYVPGLASPRHSIVPLVLSHVVKPFLLCCHRLVQRH